MTMLPSNLEGETGETRPSDNEKVAATGGAQKNRKGKSSRYADRMILMDVIELLDEARESGPMDRITAHERRIRQLEGRDGSAGVE